VARAAFHRRLSAAKVTTLQWQKARITQITRHTSRVTSFFFSLESPFEFRAGQHVDVRLTAEDGYQAQRSYSIASAPEHSGAIELAIERLDDGEVSPYFHDVAAVGDEIELRGPIGGYFVWSTSDGGPVLLVGGGSGVVPLMCMLRHRAAQRSTAPVALLFSARTWDDLIFRNELLELREKDETFALAFALTRMEPTATLAPACRLRGDYARRVDAQMMQDMLARLPAPPRQVFICGSNPFVEAAAQGAITAGTPASLIRTERYGG
jgi:ferredoxin-NADP reductase